MSKKTILVFGPDSIHTAKFIKMINDDYRPIIVTDSNVNNFECETHIIKRGLGMFGDIRRLIKQTKPDAIHIHTINRVSLPVCMVAPRHIPIILSAWGSSVLVIPHQSWFHKKIVQYCLNRSTLITVDATIERYAIARLIGDDLKVREANFGISDDYLSLLDNDVLVQKENLIYSPRGHADIYHIEKIIKSFVNFAKINDDWRMILSGFEHPVNTPLYKKMIVDAGLNDRVTFKGFVNHAENLDLNKRAKIIVSVPHSDGKSHSLMEGVTAGAIGFVSDLPSNHELITDGVNGFISGTHEMLDFTRHTEIDLALLKQVNKKLIDGCSFKTNATRFKNLYTAL